MHGAALNYVQPYLKKSPYMYFRVPPAAEVKKWKESFSHILKTPLFLSVLVGRTVFASFLKSEFSEENMSFWVACEEYKKMAPSKWASRAQQIYQQYVEVNLDAVTRQETRENVADNACPSCFNEAQKMIYTLMEKDSYRRFLNSKLIKDLRSMLIPRTTTSLTCSIIILLLN
uniref:RGS domain-containing protein n=1 Tax=Mola mola TaxID=94237 RepID=A0A3Q3X826_MOLML